MSGNQSAAADLDVDLGALFASLGRNSLRILLVGITVAGIAFLAAWFATPQYQSEARLLIETRESVFTRPNAGADSDRPILDAEGVASQVQLIGSTDILKQVAEKLGLAKLPEFDGAKVSALGRLMTAVGLQTDAGETTADERVLKKVREKLSVYNVENSRVIVIQFSSQDPRLAAEVPNAIADAYIAMQGHAKLQSNTAATEWLAPEIADLSRKVKDAEAKVADYRASSDLLIGQNNAVLATQQLSEISSELSRVRASRASAEATADSVRNALNGGSSLGAIPAVLSSSLIQRLRERQVEIKSEIADLSTTLLDNHPRIRGLRAQLADLDRQIQVEAQKVLASLETEAKTAQSREDQLIAEVNKLKAASARAGEEQVELNALQRQATAQRQLLESYMTRYREAASRQDRNYLPVDARVFSRAIIPAQPYFPKIVPIVGAAFAASLLLMAVGTLLRELFSGRAMRPAPGARFADVEQVNMPVSEPETVEIPATPIIEPKPDSRTEVESEQEPAAAIVEDARQPDADATRQLENNIPLANSSLGEVNIDGAAEKLISGRARRALFVSPEGDEAAASSILVARAVADAGWRVLLLDLTASGAASRAMLDSALFPGITNLLASQAQFSDVIHSDHYSDCHVIPVGTADPVRAMRAADRLPIIMQSLATAYDLVAVECGPTDAWAIRRLADGDGTVVLVSVLEPTDAVTEAAVSLIENGYPDLILVTPVGGETPGTPIPGRSAA
ncbi:GumC family protein [Manganibacter manganicus]|uniref:Chain-length determining protein n=1 Tax=Manganibacter manganicus TaxID=1873176 RepID=A0A1V8RWP5_9HYPH|nr:exopolysaccharide transport family protein [Pseudaminobacter manganicus]OQM77597.1 chain-length determining protein [Pseudaminobacter manganicus]